MKISVLTVVLIVFTLLSLSLYYRYKVLFGIQDDFCNSLEPKDKLSSPDSVFDAWKDCYFNRQDLHIKYGLTMFTSTLFIFIAILSWKVDQIKGK